MTRFNFINLAEIKEITGQNGNWYAVARGPKRAEHPVTENDIARALGTIICVDEESIFGM
jgi:hypothetical protein